MKYWSNLMTPRFLIALMVLGLFAGSIVVMSFFSVPEANQEVVIQLVGGVNTLAGLVIGHYFGSMSRQDHPIPVHVENTPSDPANVREQ